MTGRRALRAAAILGLGLGLVGEPAIAASPPARVDFNQPAQPLAQALLMVSRRAGVVILAPAPLTAGRMAPALRGRMSVTAALSALLDAAGLGFEIGGDGVVVVTPLGSAREAAPRPARATAREAARESAPAEVDSIEVIAAPPSARPEALKRRSAPLIDLVSEDEIARSGALGLGDALRELPNVAAISDGGETRSVAIRGVDGRFTRVRINGMETLATFGGANASGGTNRGRSFDYNVFAADLFKQIRLQKTASADIDEGSLGSTVDIQTRTPFDLPEKALKLYAEQTYNSRVGRLDPRGSIVVSRRLADDRLGVLASAAYSRRNALDAGSTAGGWQTGDAVYPGFGAVTGGSSLTAVNAALHARIPRLELMTAKQSRLGLTATLDWRPDDATRLALDLLYAKLTSQRYEHLLESFTFRTAGACGSQAAPSCGLNAVTALSPTIVTMRPGLPVLIAGVFDNVDVKSEARYDELDTIFRQATLSFSRKLANGVRASALAGFSRSDFSNPVQRTIHLDQYGVNGFAYDFRDPARPYVGFGDADLASASRWTLSELREDPNWVDNSFKTVGATVEGPWGDLQWRAGVLRKDYRTQAVTLSRSDGTIANINNLIPSSLSAVSLADYTRMVGAGVTFGAVSAPSQWLSPDIARGFERLMDACAQDGCDAFALGPSPAAGVNYAISELNDAAFVQIALPHASDRRLWGDVGLRWARTRQASSSLQVQADATLQTVHALHRYDDLLPSANVVWEPREDVTVRLAAAKVMARPDLRSLRPGFTVSTTSLKVISSGAPDLEATHATTLDAAVEWRARWGGGAALAVYHKSISSIVQQSITAPARFSANPYGLPDKVATIACGGAPGCDPSLPIWQFVRPTNTGPGRLQGVELSAAAPLGPPGAVGARWRVQGALAYSRSKIRYSLTPDTTSVVEDALGGPRVVGSVSLAYAGPRLESRITLSHRGRYLSAIPSLTGGDAEGVAAATSLDASMRFQASDRVTLTFNAMNLTDRLARQFTDRSGIPNYQHRTGREVRLGVQVRGG